MMIEQPTTVNVVENRYQINAINVITKMDTKCSSEYTHANYNEYCPSTEVAMKILFKWNKNYWDNQIQEICTKYETVQI